MTPKWIGMLLCVVAIVVAAIAEGTDSPRINAIATIILAVATLFLSGGR